jgi:enoyl-CoA hydratase/carnithine racemase
MNRPEARNAQNLQMTYDLNAAFDRAVQDDAIKVIILAGNGPHFLAGHDLRPGDKNNAGVGFPPVGNWGGFAEPNVHESRASGFDAAHRPGMTGARRAPVISHPGSPARS